MGALDSGVSWSDHRIQWNSNDFPIPSEIIIMLSWNLQRSPNQLQRSWKTNKNHRFSIHLTCLCISDKSQQGTPKVTPKSPQDFKSGAKWTLKSSKYNAQDTPKSQLRPQDHQIEPQGHQDGPQDHQNEHQSHKNEPRSHQNHSQDNPTLKAFGHQWKNESTNQ